MFFMFLSLFGNFGFSFAFQIVVYGSGSESWAYETFIKISSLMGGGGLVASLLDHPKLGGLMQKQFLKCVVEVLNPGMSEEQPCIL